MTRSIGVALINRCACARRSLVWKTYTARVVARMAIGMELTESVLIVLWAKLMTVA